MIDYKLLSICTRHFFKYTLSENIPFSAPQTFPSINYKLKSLWTPNKYYWKMNFCQFISLKKVFMIHKIRHILLFEALKIIKTSSKFKRIRGNAG